MGTVMSPRNMLPAVDWAIGLQSSVWQKKNNKLSAECEAQLNAIGLTWGKSRREMVSDWDIRFNQLVEYKKANGDFSVGTNSFQNVELGRWVAGQRYRKNSATLSEEREAKLNSIGIDWHATSIRVVPHEYTSWDTHFEQLLEYKKVNGDIYVSKILRSQNVKLWRWIAKQRHLRKISKLSEEREAKIDSIDFVWKTKKGPVVSDFEVKDSSGRVGRVVSYEHSRWGTRFEQLLEYKLEFGDCDVPQRFSRNRQLGRWVRTQRSTANKMTVERAIKLNSIGFFDSRKPPRCNQQPEPCDDVPESMQSKANPSHLGKWVTEQCVNTQKAVLEKERVAKLNASGKTIDKNAISWDALFRELLVYLQEHDGDCNVPQGYPRNPLLARWVSEQRNDYDLQRRGEQTSLTPLREAKLDAIGFTWFVRGTAEDAPAEGVCCAFRPEEIGSASKVRSLNRNPS